MKSLSLKYSNKKAFATQDGHVRRTGEQVWIAWTNKSSLDSKGRIVEILRVGNDITEHKRAEEALCQARDELEMRVSDRTTDLARVNEQLRLAGEKQHRTIEGVIPSRLLDAREKGSVYCRS